MFAADNFLFLAGILKFGDLWNKINFFAFLAISGAIWIPVEPVPTCPTILFLKLIFFLGHLPLWCSSVSYTHLTLPTNREV